MTIKRQMRKEENLTGLRKRGDGCSRSLLSVSGQRRGDVIKELFSTHQRETRYHKRHNFAALSAYGVSSMCSRAHIQFMTKFSLS